MGAQAIMKGGKKAAAMLLLVCMQSLYHQCVCIYCMLYNDQRSVGVLFLVHT